jgi:hypothetical protein
MYQSYDRFNGFSFGNMTVVTRSFPSSSESGCYRAAIFSPWAASGGISPGIRKVTVLSKSIAGMY